MGSVITLARATLTYNIFNDVLRNEVSVTVPRTYQVGSEPVVNGTLDTMPNPIPAGMSGVGVDALGRIPDRVLGQKLVVSVDVVGTTSLGLTCNVSRTVRYDIGTFNPFP